MILLLMNSLFGILQQEDKLILANSYLEVSEDT